MKKILVFILMLASFAGFTQSVITYPPGRSVVISSIALASIGGADTTFKFAFPEGCEAYGVEVFQTDTIENNDTIEVRLYGSYDNSNWIPVGDTITFDSTTTVKYDYWNGTTFPFPFGRVQMESGRVTDGDLGVILYYYK